MSLKTRPRLGRIAIAGLVALAVMVVPAVADTLLGVLTKVDVEGKKVTVVTKGTDEEVEVSVTDATELETPKKTAKLDLAKLEKRVEKAQEKGRDGVRVSVEHEEKVASKIKIEAKEKAE